MAFVSSSSSSLPHLLIPPSFPLLPPFPSSPLTFFTPSPSASSLNLFHLSLYLHFFLLPYSFSTSSPTSHSSPPFPSLRPTLFCLLLPLFIILLCSLTVLSLNHPSILFLFFFHPSLTFLFLSIFLSFLFSPSLNCLLPLTHILKSVFHPSLFPLRFYILLPFSFLSLIPHPFIFCLLPSFLILQMTPSLFSVNSHPFFPTSINPTSFFHPPPFLLSSHVLHSCLIPSFFASFLVLQITPSLLSVDSHPSLFCPTSLNPKIPLSLSFHSTSPSSHHPVYLSLFFSNLSISSRLMPSGVSLSFRKVDE